MNIQPGLFDLQIAAEDAAEQEARRDRVGERLIELGYVANEYHLNADHSLSVPNGSEYAWPWNLPSRLFKFPVETHAPEQAEDGTYPTRTLGLVHPLLSDHPFVKQLLADGFEIQQDGAPNEYGYTLTDSGEWWHAVDLIERDLDSLLKTLQYTSTEAVIQAVGFALGHKQNKKPGISTSEARRVLAFLGSSEPSVLQLNAVFAKPYEMKEENGSISRPINTTLHGHVSKEAYTWAKLQCIERGYMAYKGSFLGWTQKGVEAYGPIPEIEDPAIEEIALHS